MRLLGQGLFIASQCDQRSPVCGAKRNLQRREKFKGAGKKVFPSAVAWLTCGCHRLGALDSRASAPNCFRVKGAPSNSMESTTTVGRRR